MNSTSNGRNSVSQINFEECSSFISFIIAGFGLGVFVVGLFVNVVLFLLVRKKLAAGKRSDKLFLLSIVAVNLLSIFGCLAGHLLSRTNTLPYAQRYWLIYNHIEFISLYNNLTSMAALCYIMYESIIKFPGNRLLRFHLSIKIIAASWCLSLVLVPVGHFGIIITSIEGDSLAEKTSNAVENASIIFLIILTSTWITVCSLIIKRSLGKIYSKLKEHRDRTRQVLRQASRTKVISFHKQAAAMIFCYSICFIPHGILAALMNAGVVPFYSCVYFAGLVGVHATTVTTPLVYLTIDKRFRIKCGLGNRAVKSRQIRTN